MARTPAQALIVNELAVTSCASLDLGTLPHDIPVIACDIPDPETAATTSGAVSYPAAAIGPAGEHQVRFASIVTDRAYQAARMGMGAVMGSKRLKAVVLREGGRQPGAAGLGTAGPRRVPGAPLREPGRPEFGLRRCSAALRSLRQPKRRQATASQVGPYPD